MLKVENGYKKTDKIISNFPSNQDKVDNIFHIEVTHLIDDIMDEQQKNVAWMIYNSMKDCYSPDAIGFCLELWCNYCDEIDPIIVDEGKYAASMELFVSKLLSNSPCSNYDILYKYGLHNKYNPELIEI